MPNTSQDKTLPERLKRALEFDSRLTLEESFTPREWKGEHNQFQAGASWEHHRLTPIHERLIACVEALEHAKTIPCNPVSMTDARSQLGQIERTLDEVLTALAEELEKMEGK